MAHTHNSTFLLCLSQSIPSHSLNTTVYFPHTTSSPVTPAHPSSYHNITAGLPVCEALLNGHKADHSPTVIVAKYKRKPTYWNARNLGNVRKEP